MSKCDDKPWDSFINPKTFPPNAMDQNDGKITLKDTAGDLTGEHDLGGGMVHKKIKGKCRNTPDRMKFDSVEDTITFTYCGMIIDVSGKKYVVGCRSKSSTKDRKPLDGDDEVWVGVKTGV